MCKKWMWIVIFILPVAVSSGISQSMQWVFLPQGETNGNCTSLSDCSNNTICYGLEYTPEISGTMTSYTTGFFVDCISGDNPIVFNSSCEMTDNSNTLDGCLGFDLILMNSSANMGNLVLTAGIPIIIHQICLDLTPGDSIIIKEDEITDLSVSIDSIDNGGPEDEFPSFVEFIASSDDPCRYTYIPDDLFEQYLIDSGIDSEGTLDDQVLTNDINALINLFVDSIGILDMTGIQDFIALEQLDCSYNGFDSLNLSSNIQLTSLNIENDTALAYLNVSGTPLLSLQTSTNDSLEILICTSTQVSILDLGTNSALTHIELFDNPLLSFLNLNNGTNALVDSFDAQNNPNLTCIEVDDPSAAYNGTGVYSIWHFDLGATFFGDINHWTGATGNWYDTSNWTKGRVPEVCENVIINAISSTDTISIPNDSTIHILNLSVLNGKVLLGNGSDVTLHHD